MHQRKESGIDATPLTEVTTNICNLGIALAPSNTLSIQGITAPFPIQIAARKGKTLLFVKIQRGADRLCDKPAYADFSAGAFHGASHKQ